MTLSGDRHLRWAAYLVSGLLLVAVRLPFLTDRVCGADEAVYATQATAWLHGALPFVGTWDIKPPGIVTVYTAVFALFGSHLLPLHILGLILTWLTSLVVYELTVPAFSRQAGFWASIAYVLLSSTALGIGDLMSLNTETPQTLMLAGATLLSFRALSRHSGATTLLLASGALAAGAVFFRTDSALVLIGLWLVVFLVGLRLDRKVTGALRSSMAFAIGVVSVSVLGILAWSIGGGLQGYLSIAVSYGQAYLATPFEMTVRNILVHWAQFMARQPLLTAAWLVGAWTAISWLRNAPSPTSHDVDDHARTLGLLLLIYLCSGSIATFVGGRCFHHYFIQAMPPMAVLAGLTLGSWIHGLEKRAVRWGTVMLLVATVALGVYRNWSRSRALPSPTRDPVQIVGRYVRAQSAPQTRLFVWGWQPQVYYYARRGPAARDLVGVFATRWPLYERTSSRSRRFQAAALDALVTDLRRTRPYFIVDASAIVPDPRWEWNRYSKLRALIQRDYVEERNFFGYRIFRLRSKPEKSESTQVGSPS